MPPHRYTQSRRSHRQVEADRRAEQLATFLGRSLKNARNARRAKQVEASTAAGISQSAWSDLERGLGANVSLRVWVRAGDAVRADVRAYLERASAADQPRDAVHLRHQELVARTAATGGWAIGPEHGLGGPGVADLLLTRADNVALIEVWDWFADVGDAFRTWDRKLERLAANHGHAIAGCWVMRATRRNRELLAAHRTLFTARFPASGAEWLAALTNPRTATPQQDAILWVSVQGDRLFPTRAGSTRR